MSRAHLEALKSALEQAKWKLVSAFEPEALTDLWFISRPNGDQPQKIVFTIGGRGKFGAFNGRENTCDAISCSLEQDPENSLYFGKFSRQFQEDLQAFIRKINSNESDGTGKANT